MRSLIPALAAAAALPLFAAACSNASPAAHPASSAPSPSPSPLTGTKLKAALAPASWFPAGFKADPGGSVSTGSSYQLAAPPGHLKCSRLDATSWIQLANVGAVSFAQNDYVNQQLGQYAQEIDAFRGTGAQQAMANLRQLPARCPAFRDPQTGTTVTVHLRKGPPLGDDSLAFRLTDPHWTGGITLEAIRVGSSVVTVYFSAASGTGQAEATRLASAVTANLARQG